MRRATEKPLGSDSDRCLVPDGHNTDRTAMAVSCRQLMLPLLLVCLVFLVIGIAAGIVAVRGQGTWLLPVACGLGIGCCVWAIYFIQRSLLKPLSEIRRWVTTVRTGRLDARMPPLAPGEFQDLSDDINKLAGLIQTLDEDIDIEVDVQMQKLASKTQALELLYEVVTSVNSAYEIDDLLVHFLGRLGDVYGARGAVVRVLNDSKLALLDSYGEVPNPTYLEPKVPMRFALQNGLFGKGAIQVQSEPARSENGGVINQVISIPLQYRDSVLGCYQLFLQDEISLLKDTRELLEGVGQHLGVAVEQSRLDQEAGRLMLVEERARLANELHDSLAQTLASLRFQVRVLDETIHQSDEPAMWAQLEKLESRVEEANGELRSLIGQFRAPLQSQEVVMSVEKLIRKFRRDTGIAVFFQNEWSEDSLDQDMRTNVVRIIQECLANIKKHARAKTVRVLIRHQGGRYHIMVEDDGVGFNENEVVSGGDGEHLGTRIMQERAETLGAELKIESEPGEGSLVSLEFQLAGRETVPAAISA